MFGSWALLCGISAAQELDFRHYTVEAGLPASVVRAITQEEDGRLWLATSGGVVSYDGRRFHTLGLAEGLGWADQASVVWDENGRLYTLAIAAPFPVFRLDGERFVPIRSIDGAIAAKVEQAEVSAFVVRGGRAEETEPAVVGIGTDRGLLVYRAGGWQHLTQSDGLPSDRVLGLVWWNGRLVLATDRGLAIARGPRIDRTLDERMAQAPSAAVLALAPDPSSDDSSLWVVGSDWIGRLSDDDFRIVARDLEAFLPNAGRAPGSAGAGSRATADGVGGLFVVMDGRLFYFHPERGLRSVGEAEGLQVGQVTSVRLDREQVLWVGGEAGLAKLPDQRLASYRLEHGLFDAEVVSAIERADGTWVLGHRGGLTTIEGGSPTTRSLPLESPDGRRIERVMDLEEDGEGGLWLAAETRGVGRFEAGRGWRWYGPEAGLDSACNTLLTRRGRVWVGTDTGLLELRGERFLPPSPDSPRLKIRTLAEGSDGALLMATSTGLYRYEPAPTPGSSDGGASPSADPEASAAEGGGIEAGNGVWTSWSCGEPRCDSLFAVLEDDGYWLGTAAGLFYLPPTPDRLGPPEPGTAPIRHQAAAIDRPVFFVVREGERLWVGTDDGIVRFLPADSARPKVRLTVEDGLSGRQTMRGAALLDRQGRLILGTDRGLSIYDRRFEIQARPPPTLRILGLEVDDEVVPVEERMRFPADKRDLTFHFRAISMVDEERVLYRSWLEGVEEDWQEPFTAEDGMLRFVSLDPGEYRLHVQAAGADGSWCPTVSSPAVVIASPFWNRPWFFGLLALLSLLAAYWVQSYISQRQQSRLLEQEVARRVAELRASEDRYRKTFRTIDDGVLATDEQGRVELMNPRAEQISGWTQEAATGKPVEKVLEVYQMATNDLLGTPLPLMSGDLQDTIGPTQTAVLRARDGDRRPVEITATPIVSRGAGFTGLVFTFRDISRKRQIEAELARAQKLEAVGILAGGIAHDFNNLLTVLLGNISLIQDTSEGLDDESVQNLEDAETALMRARDLTQQLLTFSRGGAPVREAASISEVIRDSASFVLSGSKARCDLDLAEDLWVVEIDAGQISQVLNNLLINASQAMPAGGAIGLRARNVEQAPDPLLPGRYVLIEVEDSGIGIAEGLLDRIFEPYFSTKEEGRGLGLASAYSIIKKHDGLLTVDSVLGRGTTFRIYLPASSQRTFEPRQTRESVYEGSGRILVMDDDPVVRRTCGAMLERLGFEVVFSSDGRSAIDLYAGSLDNGERFEAVMMDLTVPGGMGGQDAMKRLQSLDPQVVAIVYSGYSNDPVLARYRDYGFKGRLSKPFRLKDLRAVLEEVVGSPGE